ncbi:hypothetical protein K466DRAFT_485860 [Polyporus arcularius HHB13444]|uniref:Uncharacterized protein n=1 Tax=Polyporus arcularius HHB13444 TaxID=1314778 RepID=A0A5C3PNL3_9APHY|nr:hypothetical protein K466DRAFT_485860 [Polyporus arcularius HHB13444]
MSEDEYDAYYLPVNPEDFAAIDAAAAQALAGDNIPEVGPSLSPNSQAPAAAPPDPTTSQASPDEYDEYDFSEFTADDFVEIDAMVLVARATPPPPEPAAAPAVHAGSSSGGPGPGSAQQSNERGGPGGGNGGPRIQIAVEGAAKTDSSSSRYLKGSSGKGRAAKLKPKLSPYEQFRSWNRLLSVTDIASPSWCEVQFDYGLRQKRYKKLADRPESFVTAEGKTITVAQPVAAVNDRTVTRGRSVHKVLEREIKPEAVTVDIKTAEERWALRLVNLLVSLQILLEQGRCREVPVFGLVHDQIVTGIIDEIVRAPVSIPKPTPTPKPSPSDEPVPSRSSPNKRSASRTPRKSGSKRCRQEADPDQPSITSFFTPSTPSKEDHRDDSAMSVDPSTPPPAMNPLPELDTKEHATPGPTRYSLHLSDTKTRIRPSLPPDEDTYASRIQLMLYHRLLSNLLATADHSIPSSQPLDFGPFWGRAGVDPQRKFSDSFIEQTGLSPSSDSSSSSNQSPYLSGLSCLDDLTAAWRHAVEALNVAGIDRTLTLVYRAQPTTRRRKGKQKDPASASLSGKEAQDLAAAIQASISDVHPGQGGDDELARAIFESLKDSVQSGETADGELGVLTHPFGPPISAMSSFETAGSQEEPDRGQEEGTSATGTLAADPELAWALQESLLSRVDEVPVLKEVLEEPPEVEVQQTSEDNTPQPVVPEDSPGSEELTRTKSGAVDDGHSEDGLPKTTPSSPVPAAEESTEDENMTVAELETEARIIGTKEFELDDAFLDEYLTRVLAWWYGERPPQGVEVELTRRCVTCEYRDGCEWREKKAEEAMRKYRERSGSGSPPVPAGAVEAWL